MAQADKNIIFAIAFALTLSICQSHLASVVQSSGEGRLPLSNFVDRVSRGPSIRSNEDEPDLSNMHVRPGLKSPAFQYRLLPNKNSQLYQNAPGPLSLAQLSPFHIQSPTDPATSASEDQDKTSQMINDSMDQEEAPTFTPFIGARALSNMGKFFEHLRENLVAMQQEGSGSGEIGQPELRRLSSRETEEVADSGPEITSSEARLLAQALRWTPPATGNHRDSRLFGPPGARQGNKYQTFIQPVSDQEAYLRKANNYNPSWLWTNMGLGRRR